MSSPRRSWVGPLLCLLCVSVGAFLAFEAGIFLLEDAYAASRGGAAWFSDSASRVAIPLFELGVVSGLTFGTALYVKNTWRVVRNLGMLLWACFLIDVVIYLLVDHPGCFIGLC